MAAATLRKMPIQEKVSPESYELIVSGRVNDPVAKELEQKVLAAVNTEAKEILVNLAESDFISTSGIRVLLQYWRLLKGRGRKLRVVHPSAPISEVLQMTGIREAVMDENG